MTDPTLARCPICRSQPRDIGWFGEQFLIDCPQCTQYTITLPLANRFLCLLDPAERRILEGLSRYLRHAGDDDEREITEDSWPRLAAEA